MDTSPFTPRDPNFERRVRDSFAKQQVMRTIGAQLDDVAPGSVTVRLPFRADLTQQHGYLHAGIATTVLDSACGYAALSLMAADRDVLSVEFKINLLTPAAGTHFLARGRVLRSGRTLTTCVADLMAIGEEGERLVATMLGTMMAVGER